jgi:hypothetical protein
LGIWVETGGLIMLLSRWNMLGYPCIVSLSCYMYLLITIRGSYAAVSNARLMFSYTRNVIIVPGRTRITEATRLGG